MSGSGAPMQVEFEALTAARAKEAEDVLAMERAKLCRTLNVPTNDAVIRQRLRQCGVPAVMFGEDPADRRERFKAQGAMMLTSGPDQIKLWHAIMETQKELDRETEIERAQAHGTMYYTEGGPDLAEARRAIARSSFERSQRRLALAHTKLETSQAYLHRLRSIKTFHCGASVIGDSRPLSAVAFGPAASGLPGSVLTGSWSGTITLWDLPSSASVRTFSGTTDRITDVKFAPGSEGQRFAGAGVDGVIQTYAIDDATASSSLIGHSDRISKLAFHPDSSHLLSTSFDATFRLWDVCTSQCILTQDGSVRPLYAVAVHPDGSLVGTGDLAGNGRLWDLRTGKAVMDMVGHIKQVLAMDFSPNGYHVATGAGDNAVIVWDIRKRSRLYTIPGHMSMVSGVKFARHDAFLVSSSYDSTVRVWSSRDFSPITSLRGHEDKVSGIDASDDFQHFVTTSFDRTWKVWSALPGDRSS